MKDKIIETKTDRIANILKDFKALNELEQIKQLYFYAKIIDALYPIEISEGAIHEVVQEMLTGLKGDDRIIPEDYFRAGIAWALSNPPNPVSEGEIMRLAKKYIPADKILFDDAFGILLFIEAILAKLKGKP